MNGFKRCTSNTVINATNWRTFMQKGAAVLEATVPTNQRITIRFEDLTSNPDFVLQQLCSFLDLSFHSDMLSFDASSHQDLSFFAHDSLGDAQTVVYPSNIATKTRWTAEMASEDIATVEHIAHCGPWLSIFSYERQTKSLTRTERLRCLPSQAYCTLKHWQHRTDRAPLVHRKVL